MLNHRPMRDAKASSRRCQVGTPSLSTHEASIGRDLDWPLRAAEARALDTSLTLGDCISSSLQECLSHVPAHGFEIFRATHARPTVQPAGLNLRVRVRACPSASDVANGTRLHATIEDNDDGEACLVLRRKGTAVSSLTLREIEVVRIGERMVALVPLLVGRAPRWEINSCVENMGILALKDDEAMDKFRSLLVAGGLDSTIPECEAMIAA
jgi:hypothetical protein